MRLTGSFCPKCKKGTQMTWFKKGWTGWSEQYRAGLLATTWRITACTTCRWTIRWREVTQGIYHKVEEFRSIPTG